MKETQEQLREICLNNLCVNLEPNKRRVEILRERGVHIITSDMMDGKDVAHRLMGIKGEVYFTPHAVVRILTQSTEG